jgi:hypothetical protein
VIFSAAIAILEGELAKQKRGCAGKAFFQKEFSPHFHELF